MGQTAPKLLQVGGVRDNKDKPAPLTRWHCTAPGADLMTGFAALSVAEEGPSDHEDSSWTGVSRILGPRWARFPIITVSFLGAQLLWSVEMSYGKNRLGLTLVGS